MKKLSKDLEIPFLELVAAQGDTSQPRSDYLKWLRYYLDYCAKYGHPPRDRDSLPLFLQKLASKRQSPEQQKQAADSVTLYYELISRWQAMSEAGKPAPVTKTSWDDCYRRLKEEIALRHYSPKTWKTYRTWIVQFQEWLSGKLPEDLDSEDARGFLTHLAVDGHVASSTQNQAFNALLFLYRYILERDYDIGDKVVRAKRTKYIPVVLSRREVDLIVRRLRQPYRLIVQLLYGCGLRMSECLNLRVKDLNFDHGIITVHRGKGGKDRTVPMPKVLVPDLNRQLEHVEELLRQDLAENFNGVFMPDALDRKWSNASKDLTWQWLFPAKMLTLVQGSLERRRFHLHETKLQKALRGAVRRSGIKKRVTCHTFRHSFASHLLRANYDIRTIQQLLGHSDVRTTMIYTHTVRSRTIKEIESPLDFPKAIAKTMDGFDGGTI